ncbi:hypothetical protein JB92DRAFT_1672965 [Gautieria morchelliformis]|nr:hypothetical protein JB92DRAFT_1672965 [Gautieria morchelliformis]
MDTRGHSNQTQTLKYKSKSIEVGIGMSRPGVVAISDKIEKLDRELNYNQNHCQLDVSTPHDSARGGRIKMREALDVTVLPGSTGKGGDVVGQIIRNEPSRHGPPDSHMSREPRDPDVSSPFFVGQVRRSGAEGERVRLVDSESQAEDGRQVGDKKGRLTQTYTSNSAEEGVQIGRFHPDAGGTISGSREQRNTYTGQHSTQKSKSESANLRAGSFHTDVIVSESQTGHGRHQVTDSVALHGASGVRDNLNVVELPKGGEKKTQTRTSTGHEITIPRTTQPSGTHPTASGTYPTPDLHPFPATLN